MRKRKGGQEESTKVPEAGRQTGGEATVARAAGGFAYSVAEDLGSEDVLALCGGGAVGS